MKIPRRGLQGVDERHSTPHEADNAVSRAASLRHLAASRACRAAPSVVRIIASADDWRIANSSRELPCPTGRTHATCEIAGRVARDDVHGSTCVAGALRILAQTAGKLSHSYTVAVVRPGLRERGV